MGSPEGWRRQVTGVVWFSSNQPFRWALLVLHLAHLTEVFMRSFFLLAVGLVLLTGCKERPEAVPAPKPGIFRGAQACPDLTGAYALKREDTGWTLGGEVLEQALKRTPKHHSILVIESVNEDRMVLRTQATQEDTKQAFFAWRDKQPYQYALWRHALTARSTSEGILLEHDERKKPNPVKVFPTARTFEISGSHYDCKRGWLVFKGEEEPDVNNLRSAQVRMTKSDGGGLVATAKFSFEQTLSLWCGDGCRPNTPFRTVTRHAGGMRGWWQTRAIRRSTGSPSSATTTDRLPFKTVIGTGPFCAMPGKRNPRKKNHRLHRPKWWLTTALPSGKSWSVCLNPG